ncbi:HSP20-like chaperone [Epithele typhae]|uniref:HSP20-like chaperone n=1 Tax=Epithele typhae TaxID=378194 RepID=UPI002007B78A|nr:HSP20-like chaperone [Epithele typhae]KAH9926564.1 HSP20-like chaperone [Epithele typhae]
MSLFNLFNDSFFSDFDRKFDEAVARRTASPPAITSSQAVTTSVLRPRIDVHEDKEKNLVTATFELPGINKQDVSIDVHDSFLTVSGETKTETNRDEGGVVLRERRYGKFSRSVPVPEGVKPEDIKAAMENGVLTVTIRASPPKGLPRESPSPKSASSAVVSSVSL